MKAKILFDLPIDFWCVFGYTSMVGPEVMTEDAEIYSALMALYSQRNHSDPRDNMLDMS